MKKLGMVLLVLSLLMSVPAWATVAVVNGDGVIHVTLDGSGGFDWTSATVTSGKYLGAKLKDLYPNGLALTAIFFYPSAAGAIGVWRNLATTGVIMGPKFYSVDGGPQVAYFTGDWLRKPCLVHADQTTDTSTEWFFVFDTSK